MSRTGIAIRAAARDDLAEHYRWLHDEAGIEIAERFLLGADAAFSLLAANPGLGAPVNSNHERLAGLRKWTVEGFPNLLIFYQSIQRGVSIVRVIHAARDWWALVGLAE